MSGCFTTLVCVLTVWPEQMPDRTTEVAQSIQESYPAFEFVPIRLSNAFDKRWWKTICSGTLGPDFAARLDPGEGIRR